MPRQLLAILTLVLLATAAKPIQAADEAPDRASVGTVWSLAYSPDGRTLATGSGDGLEHGTLALWDVLGGKARFWLPQPARVRSVAFSPDGEKVAAGCWDDKVRIYEARTAKLLATHKGHTQAVVSVAFSPDGRTLASASLDKTIVLWDAAKGAEMRRLIGHVEPGSCVAFFADGKSLASAGHDATVRIWDVETGKERQKFKDPAAPRGFASVAISPDGKTIAAGGWDCEIYLWDVDKGEIRKVLDGHTMPVLSLAFSADGKTLASTSGHYNRSAPGEVRLWTMPAGNEQAKWIGHTDSIWGVCFAPDGRTLATVSTDQTVKVWETATGKERATLDNGSQFFEKNPPPVLTDQELEEIWRALAGADGATVQSGVARLVQAPDQAAPWLAKRLGPASKLDAEQAKSVHVWIAKLDADDFDTREKAVDELAKLGAAARPALQKALEDFSSAEQRQRINGLLDKLGKSAIPPEDLRGVRAIEALELIHTDAAKELLKRLAEGMPDSALTREAAASCRRLAKQP